MQTYPRLIFLYFSLLLPSLVLAGSLDSSQKEAIELKKNSIEARIDVALKIYNQDIRKKFGKALIVHSMWDKRKVIFEAAVDSRGGPHIYLGGGALLLSAYTPDIFNLIFCHELGHLIGGPPFKRDHPFSSSVEGQADYFAISCFAEVIQRMETIEGDRGGSGTQESMGERGVFAKAKRQEIQEFCQASVSDRWPQSLCLRVGVTAYLSMMSKESFPLVSPRAKFDEIGDTLNGRPSQKCRVWTFFAAMAQRERPGCWFKNKVSLSGRVPKKEFPQIFFQSQKVWDFWVSHLNLSSQTVAPEIFLFPFEKGAQGDSFLQWQRSWILSNLTIWEDWASLKSKKGEEINITRSWVEENIDQIFPFPKSFLAFHYDGTNRIQMNPRRTLLANYHNGPYGKKKDFLGSGFYSMGHEMLHYALEQHHVQPTKIHHCLFVTPLGSTGRTLLEEMTEFLVDEKLSSPLMLKFGPDGEKSMDPCSRLTSLERQKVSQYAKQL